METRKRNRRNDSESSTTNSKSPIISKLKNEGGRPESPAYATRSRKKIDDNLVSLSANLNDQRKPRSQKNSESEMGSLASSANNSPTRPLKKVSSSVDNSDAEQVEQKGHRMTAKLNEVRRRTLRGRIIEEPSSNLAVATTLLQEINPSVEEKEVEKELENLEDWSEDEEHSKSKKIYSSSDEEPFTKGRKEKHKQVIESDSGSGKEDSEEEENHTETRRSRIKQKFKKQTPSKNTRTNKCATSPVLSRNRNGKASHLSPEQPNSEEYATSPLPSINAGLSSKYRGTPPKNKKITGMPLPPALLKRLASSSTKFLDYTEKLLPNESENLQVSQVALENELEKSLESDDVSIDSVSTVESPSTRWLDTNRAGLAEKKSPVKSNSTVQSLGKVDLLSETCSVASTKPLSPEKSSSPTTKTNHEVSFKTSADVSEVEKNNSVSPRKTEQVKSLVNEGNKSKSPGKFDKTAQLEAAEKSDTRVELQPKSSSSNAKMMEESEKNDADREMSTIAPTGNTASSKSPSKNGKAANEFDESDSGNKLDPKLPMKSNKLESGGFKPTNNTAEEGYESSDGIKSDDSSPFKSPHKSDKFTTAIEAEIPEETVPDDGLPNVSPSKSKREEEISFKNQSQSKTAIPQSVSENILPVILLSKLDEVVETTESKSPGKTNTNKSYSSDKSENNEPPKKSPVKAKKQEINSSDESENDGGEKQPTSSPLKYTLRKADSSDESESGETWEKDCSDESDEGEKQPSISPVKSTQRKTDSSDESESNEIWEKDGSGESESGETWEKDGSGESESDGSEKHPVVSSVKATQRKTDSSDESESNGTPKKSPGKANKTKFDHSEESDEDDNVPASFPAKATKRKLDGSEDDESDEQENGTDAQMLPFLKNVNGKNRKSILNVSTEDETANTQTKPRAVTNKSSSNVVSSKTLPRKSDPKHVTHLQSDESFEESELSGSATPQKFKLATQKSKASVEAKPAVQSKQPKTPVGTTPKVNKPLTIIERLTQGLQNLPPSSKNAPEPDKELSSSQNKKWQPVSVTSSSSEYEGDSDIEYRMVRIIPEKNSTSAKRTSVPTKKKVASSTSEDSSDDEVKTVTTITKPTSRVSASTKTSALPAKTRDEVQVSSESDDSSDDDIEMVKTITKPTATVSETTKTSVLPEKRKGEELVSSVSKKSKQWSWSEVNDTEEQDIWGNSVIKSTVKQKGNAKESSVRQQRKLDLEKQLRALRNWNVTEAQETAEVRVLKDWQVTEAREEANVSVSSAWEVTEVGDASQNKKRKKSSLVSNDAKDSGSQSSAILSKQDSQKLTNGGKKLKISELNKAVTNGQEGSDSDDAPDEQSFAASRMSAFAVLKHAMQSAQLGQQEAKKKRREKHERFMAEKQNVDKMGEKATAGSQGQTKSKSDGQQQDKKIVGSKLPMSVLEQLDPQTTTPKPKKKKQKQQSEPEATKLQTVQMQPSQQTEGEQPKSKSQIKKEKKKRKRLLAAAQAEADICSEPQTSHVTKFVIADPSSVEAATKSKADKWRQRVMNFKPKVSASKASAIKERLKWSSQGQKISTWST